MQKMDKVLLACNTERSLETISQMTGWKGGSASVVINQLIAKKLLKKTRRGFYAATPKGLKQISKIIQRDSPPRHDDDAEITTVAYRAAAVFTADSRFDMIATLKYGRETLKPSAKTRELGDIFKKIYTRSLKTIEFKHAEELAKNMWMLHKRPHCECGFDFESAYEIYAKDLERFAKGTKLAKELDRTAVFRNLRWESFPDIEKYRRSFGLKTMLTKAEIPENWNE